MAEEFDGLDTVEKLIDGLEGFAQKTPFFLPHKVVIPDHEFFRISMALRESLPAVIKNAKQIVAERNAIIENAKQEHKRILEAAEKRAQELVQEDAIVRQSLKEAENIIARARREADEIKREALLYTEKLLAKLNQDLTGVLEEINNGRRLINSFLEKTGQTEESGSSGSELA